MNGCAITGRRIDCLPRFSERLSAVRARNSGSAALLWRAGLFVMLLFGTGRAAAQECDSLRRFGAARHAWADRLSTTRSSRMTYVAVPLIAAGAVVSVYDADFRRLRNGYAPQFRYHYDDYLQYAPAGVLVGMKAFGVRGRSSWGRMLLSDAFSAGIMALAVNSLKYTCRVMRPDGSSRNSFPSGHTATAFMTATMLHKEYGHLSPWISIGAYGVATATGVSRQLNNKHWMSDVMVGAGIGILATELGYLLCDLIFRDKGLHVSETYSVYDRYRRPSFVSFAIGAAVAPGSFRLRSGERLSLRSGPSASISGAGFFSPWLGVGGRLSVTDMELLTNETPSGSSLRYASAMAGLYGSWPFSARWLLGGRLLGGCGFHRNEAAGSLPAGRREGFAFGAGLGSTFLATRNFGVRLSLDYDMAPPAVAGAGRRLHLATFSLEACAVF